MAESSDPSGGFEELFERLFAELKGQNLSALDQYIELEKSRAPLAIEDLKLDGMKRLWGRKVSDYAFAEFVRILAWVCLKRGVRLRKVGRFYASTKTCHDCGHKQELGLADRRWVCMWCDVEHDRDVNAALNVRDRALSLWRGEVRQAAPALAA